MSFFRYPGGKAKLRDVITLRIAAMLDGSSVEYREPFFGGGSVWQQLIESRRDISSVWFNDRDVGLACLWTAILRDAERFKRLAMDFKPTVNEFEAAKTRLLGLGEVPNSDCEITAVGFLKLVVHQLSYSGLGTKSGGPLGGKDQKSQYKIDCRWSPGYICKKIDAICHRLSSIPVRESRCTALDFSDVVCDDSLPAVLYLDPPYFLKGNDLYQHGMSVEDHERLAGMLEKCKHKWLLSYDDCDEVRKFYGWARIEQIDVKYSITATKHKESGARSSTKKPELLISPM